MTLRRLIELAQKGCEMECFDGQRSECAQKEKLELERMLSAPNIGATDGTVVLLKRTDELEGLL